MAQLLPLPGQATLVWHSSVFSVKSRLAQLFPPSVGGLQTLRWDLTPIPQLTVQGDQEFHLLQLPSTWWKNKNTLTSTFSIIHNVIMADVYLPGIWGKVRLKYTGAEHLNHFNGSHPLSPSGLTYSGIQRLFHTGFSGHALSSHFHSLLYLHTNILGSAFLVLSFRKWRNKGTNFPIACILKYIEIKHSTSNQWY